MHAETVLAKLKLSPLHMARDVQGNKEDFYRCISSNRKVRGNLSLLLNRARD